MDSTQLDNATPGFSYSTLASEITIILSKLNKDPGESTLGQFAGIWYHVGTANIGEKGLVKIPVCFFSAFFLAPALTGRQGAHVCSPLRHRTLSWQVSRDTEWDSFRAGRPSRSSFHSLQPSTLLNVKAGIC